MVVFTDTNILIDLVKIDLAQDFFRIEKYGFCICREMFDDEVLLPREQREMLLCAGLQLVDLSPSEAIIARRVQVDIPKLSKYDCIAYAIAKTRGYILATGDRRLAKYARENGVRVHGLVWTMQECEDNGTPRSSIADAIAKIISDDRIRIPTELLRGKFTWYFEE